MDVSKTPVGICYQCAMNCHGSHDILELYTKRNFCCDCGNTKFESGFKCLLLEEKDALNLKNVYGQNFSGLYCTCHKPYPDEEDESPEEMIQCGLCEDWFHDKHLNMPSGASIPSDYEELTCPSCCKAHPFLSIYHSFFTSNTESSKNGFCQEPNNEPSAKKGKLENICSGSNISCRLKAKAESVGIELTNSGEPKICIDDLCQALFWPSGWRSSLCACASCKKMYSTHHLDFILDPEDTIAYYLEVGKAKSKEMDQQDSAELSKLLLELPRPAAVHIATGG
ncbi:unnamed protein product [Protopolystoma xenopodis]|uniref:UBR-type domain-containing protein n=1 Tax=Protopolystoma xenopodis TaxID=117903 RepID=A0A3S5AGH9_9PLAT|nr:unnamed protein product [Protopolystoma xenopodis]